jgi:2-polyprenyl-3-methyl-5-hydroxy-6-metoxy-1,4-benzoquinol methylase
MKPNDSSYGSSTGEGMAALNTSTFGKYSAKGPYHWKQISKNLRDHHCHTSARYAIALEMLGDCRDKKVLDIGCGDGALTYLIARKGALVTGCEPEPDGRSLAVKMFEKHKAEATFVAGMDGLAVDSFDTVVMTEVIEHLSAPRQMLERIRDVLKPGGSCIASTPVRMTETPLDREHIREFWPSEFPALIAEYFDIVEHRLDISAFWMEFYYWRPFGIPLPKLLMNVCSAWFGIERLRRKSPCVQYPTIQTILARKRA